MQALCYNFVYVYVRIERSMAMYLETLKNNGIVYLRLVESVYSPGKKGGRKRVLLNLGPLSKVDDGKPEFLKRLKDSFREGKPILDPLRPFCGKREAYSFTVGKGDPVLVGHPRLFSQVLIERILEELGLIGFLSRYRSYKGLSYDLVGFFRALVYGRILNPASKIATVAQGGDYHNPLLVGEDRFRVYDTLDFIHEYSRNIVDRMNKSLVSSFGRTTDCVYYDCTNFFFETDRPDPDVLDDDGGVKEKGLRKYGVSKEERHLPIVQMGMFMDEQGLPITLQVFPGNTLDHRTVRKSLESVEGLCPRRFIFVGDRGMHGGDNSAAIVEGGNGYIVGKGLGKTKAEEKAWMLDGKGYTSVGDGFRYKSRTVKRKVKAEGGERELTEKVVVYWSRRFMERQLAENRSFLDFLEKLEKDPGSFKVTKAQSRSLKRFLGKDCVIKSTGEAVDASEIRMMVDFDKVNRYRETFGYYQIVTSELDMPDTEVIDKYHGLSRIEEQFRIMKGTLDTMPLHVRTPGHVHAHLLVCMIALTVVRIIQNRIAACKGKDPSKEWEAGLSGRRLVAALNDWKVELYADGLFRFCDVDKPDLRLVLDAFGIGIRQDLYTRADLVRLKAGIRVK